MDAQIEMYGYKWPCLSNSVHDSRFFVFAHTCVGAATTLGRYREITP